MVHILHFAAAGCQNCGIGVEAGVAAQDRARDDGAHRQQRISAMEKHNGRIMGVTIAGMPQTLPVLKFKTATVKRSS